MVARPRFLVWQMASHIAINQIKMKTKRAVLPGGHQRQRMIRAELSLHSKNKPPSNPFWCAHSKLSSGCRIPFRTNATLIGKKIATSWRVRWKVCWHAWFDEILSFAEWRVEASGTDSLSCIYSMSFRQFRIEVWSFTVTMNRGWDSSRHREFSMVGSSANKCVLQ